MSLHSGGNDGGETGSGTGSEVLVRYWAGARAAAGTDHEPVPVTGETTLAEVLAVVLERHRGTPRFKDVVGVCSVLVGEQPVGKADPAEVVVRPGDVVELLPPFAGG